MCPRRRPRDQGRPRGLHLCLLCLTLHYFRFLNIYFYCYFLLFHFFLLYLTGTEASCLSIFFMIIIIIIIINFF